LIQKNCKNLNKKKFKTYLLACKKHTDQNIPVGLIPQTKKKTSQKILVPVLSKEADQNILTYSN